MWMRWPRAWSRSLLCFFSSLVFLVVIALRKRNFFHSVWNLISRFWPSLWCLNSYTIFFLFCYVFAHLFLCCFSSSKTNETWEEKYFSDSPKTVRSMANHHHQNRFREEIFCITMASRFFPIFGFFEKIKTLKILKIIEQKKRE